MSDIDPQAVAALNEALRTGAISQAQFSKGMANLSAVTERFASVSLKRVSDGLDDLHDQVKDGVRNYRELGGDLRNYAKQIERITDAGQRQEAQDKLGLLAQKAYSDSLASGAKQVGVVLVKGIYDYYKQQVMTGIRGIQGDGSPFQVAADLQSSAITSVANTAGQLGGTLGKVGQGLMSIPHPAAMVAGALLQLGGSILESGAKEAAELMKFKLEVVSKELEKSYKSFQQATGAGALFAGGMTELRNTGLEAGLTQEQFSKVIAENSTALASFGGDVTSGGKKLAKVVSNFGEGTKKELLNLGISVEDQAQGVADYMSMLQRTGNLRGQSDAQLAEESKNYMVQLKAISSFTGEDAKKAEARARQAAAQGAVAAKLQELGPEAAAKFNAAIKLLPESQQKAAQQMLAFGKVIDPELAQTLGPASTQLLSGVISDVKDASVTAETAQQNFYSTLDSLSPALQAEGKKMAEIFGTVALANGQYANQSAIAVDVLTLANKNLRRTVDETSGDTALDKAKLAMTTQDQLTTKVGESVIALQGMKTAIQDMFTGPITTFAKDVPGILAGFKTQLERMGILETKVERGRQSDAAFNQMGTGEKIESGIARTVEKIGDGLNTVLSMVGITALDSVMENAKNDRVASEANYLKNRDASDRNNILPPSLNSVLSVLGLPKFADGGISNGGVLSNGGQLAMVSEGGMAEAHVPLPNGKSIPVEMASGRSGGSDDDFKRQILENNNLMIAALRQMQEIYTKSMETTKLVSSTIAADSETSAALLEAMNAVVGVLEDSKYELQDQSSSLKKLYDVTA